jgi:hypothetical protein
MMADKTEEQIAKEREAIDAMRNAKANMTTALDRIATLERGLQDAVSALARAKTYVGPSCYVYYTQGGPTNVSCHADIDKSIATARQKLGVTA